MPALPEDGTTRVMIDRAFAGERNSRSAILQAIQIWNNFSQNNFGRPLFQAEETSVPRLHSGPTRKDDCDQVDGHSNSFVILMDESNAKEESSRWHQLGLTVKNPGVTLRCYDRNNDLEKQVILINVLNTDTDQFLSVALHELGHVIGLDHSCSDGASSERFRGCADLAWEHPYREAVMFPRMVGGAISRLRASDVIEKKETIQSNDAERANCLYQHP